MMAGPRPDGLRPGGGLTTYVQPVGPTSIIEKVTATDNRVTQIASVTAATDDHRPAA
jgi:hypothetical protein